MQALIWDGQSLAVDEVPPPTLPNADWALVRVTRAGICSTDLHILDGYAGFTGVLGHEMVGVVEKGPVQILGSRVVAEINFACMACADCKEGLRKHCGHRQVMGIRGAQGAFAELVAVPWRNIHELPNRLSDDVAVFAEPAAAACELLRHRLGGPGSRVLVLGAGKLGLLCAQVLTEMGSHVVVRGRHERKLLVAREIGLNTESADADTDGYDVVVDATGSSGGLTAAMQAVKAQGTLVLKTTMPRPHDVDLSPLVVKEIRVIGSRCGPFRQALQRLRDGRIVVEELIDARYPLANGVEAFAYAAQPGNLKVLLGNSV